MTATTLDLPEVGARLHDLTYRLCQLCGALEALDAIHEAMDSDERDAPATRRALNSVGPVTDLLIGQAWKLQGELEALAAGLPRG